MRAYIFLLLLLLLTPVSLEAFSDQEVIQNAIEKMRKTKVGRKLLESNPALNKNPKRFIVKGPHSHAEIRVIFSIEERWLNGEKIESGPMQVHQELGKIAINPQQEDTRVFYDLIHEITHFTRANLKRDIELSKDIAQFIKRRVEGPGGELEAVVYECLVYDEIKKKGEAIDPPNKICANVKNRSTSFLKEIFKKEFYAVGPIYYEEIKHLKEKIPYLSPRKGFEAANPRMPYPIIFLKDFEKINKSRRSVAEK